MSHVTDFVQSWVAENINAEPYEPGDQVVAAHVNRLKIDAQAEGISSEDLVNDLGDLADFISEALETATDNEVERLASKDD